MLRRILFLVLLTWCGVAMAKDVAEDFLRPLKHGFWQPEVTEEHPENEFLVRGYLDFEVRNFAFEKMLFVTLHLRRENGVVEHFLYPLTFRSHIANGRERWGSNQLVIPTHTGWHGAIVAVDFTFHLVLRTARWNGAVHSAFQYRLATGAELMSNAPGEYLRLGENPFQFAVPKDYLARAASSATPETRVFFSPYDDPEIALIGSIDDVIAAKAADPDGFHYIHASIYDVNDPRIVDRLLVAHAAGVEVVLLTAVSHLNAFYEWETEFPRMQRAGIRVIGVQREGFAASNHTKIGIFDGRAVTTGSCNWETRAAEDNSENTVWTNDPSAIDVYKRIFLWIHGLAAPDLRNPPGARLRAFYSRRTSLANEIHRSIEGARSEIVIAMFTLRRWWFHDGRRRRELLASLTHAVQRGVKVHVLLESNIADEGEYYGRITPNDLTDEELAEAGVAVSKIHTMRNNNKYAAMHHKFAVIDRRRVLTGSANWFSPSDASDDDLLVIDDESVALRFLGEYLNLRKRYDPGFATGTFPCVAVDINLRADQTMWGENVLVSGDLPELGNWEPTLALPLDGSAWPDWHTRVVLPLGTNFEFKLLFANAGEMRWEDGPNRRLTALAGEEVPCPGTG